MISDISNKWKRHTLKISSSCLIIRASLTAFLLFRHTFLIDSCNVELRAYLAVTSELVGAGAPLGGERKTVYLSHTKILGRAKISRKLCLETRFICQRWPWAVESIVEELYLSSRRQSHSWPTLYLPTATLCNGLLYQIAHLLQERGI